MKFWLIFSLLIAQCASGNWMRTAYPLTDSPIDVVIPCVSKDAETLELCIEGIKQNGRNIRKIFVVSKEKMTDSAEWFDEAKYPFNKEEIALELFRGDQVEADRYLANPKNRLGWMYQQFLKLYASFVIPDISENILILDSDVVFLKEAHFVTAEGSPLFTPAAEYTKEYFDHAQRLLPGFRRAMNLSGIAHHMLFQRPILISLFDTIAATHQVEPWRAICHCIDSENLFKSPFSEYEIYFNYTWLTTDQARLQRRRWADIQMLRLVPVYRNMGYDYVACHEWARTGQ